MRILTFVVLGLSYASGFELFLDTVTAPWKNMDKAAMEGCYDRILYAPDWYDWGCGGARWRTNARGWKSAFDCRSACEGALWKGIIKGYSAVKCSAVHGLSMCYWSYCNDHDDRAVSPTLRRKGV
jgi:hypothetical protein